MKNKNKNKNIKQKKKKEVNSGFYEDGLYGESINLSWWGSACQSQEEVFIFCSSIYNISLSFLFSLACGIFNFLFYF